MSHPHTEFMQREPSATRSTVNIDRVDPTRVARFCAGAFGRAVIYRDGRCAMIEGSGIKIGFGKIKGLQPIPWPDESGAKPFPVGLQGDDLDEAADGLCALGASQPECHPGAGRWRVLLDLAGQAFCLSSPPVDSP